MKNTFYQGSQDVFLAKVRYDFDKVTEQSKGSLEKLQNYSIIGTTPASGALFTSVNESSGAVWRHVGTTAVKNQGKRNAGGVYPETEFIRTWETAVHDPDEQDANAIHVPEEREMKEAAGYRDALNRGAKIFDRMVRTNYEDPFEVFNLAFTAPASMPTRFFVAGNMGLDGNNTPLNERLVSTQHARADGGATQSNALNASGNARPFSSDAVWSARQQGGALKDDVGGDMPMFGGTLNLVIPNANGYVKEAMELNGSPYEPGNAENQVNVMKGVFGTVITSPTLLGSKYVSGVANTTQWFLVDPSGVDREVGTGLMHITFVPMQTKVERDSNTDSIVYKAKQEHVYGFCAWRAVIGSNGTGSAYSS